MERFGDAAAELGRAIPAALHAAENRALAGHQAMGLRSNDVYGQMWQTQHEELVRYVGHIGGVREIRPRGARYTLLVVGEQSAILYPWRYADDLRKSVDEARMRMSDVRRRLLELNPEELDSQLTFDHADKTETELRAEAEEAAQLLRDFETSGRLVLIAYASNPRAGLMRIYWGDAIQADDTGRIRWPYREELPVNGQGRAHDLGRVIRPVPPPDDLGSGLPRFDDAPLEEPSLGVRPPLTSPDNDPTTTQPETGSDD